jgi:hypothetical protein
MMGVATTSVLGRFCCKNRKSNEARNLASVDFFPTPLLHGAMAPLRKSMVALSEAMRSLTSTCAKRSSGSKKSRPSGEKTFSTLTARNGHGAMSGLSPLSGCRLNRSTQHFILEGKDGVWDGGHGTDPLRDATAHGQDFQLRWS